MVPVHKAIVSNNIALQAKYGAAGATAIYTALSRVIAHDAARGLTTQVFNIDTLAHMAAVHGKPVIGSKDERGAKEAVDAIHGSLACDYIMLLDGPDVIPHIELNPISGIGDPDRTIPSDLPYASSSPFSKVAANFLNVTRVVGRLPACVGEKDHLVLVDLIDACIAHAPLPAQAFSPFFAISADIWQISTQLSLNAVFGSTAGLYLSGPSGHSLIDPSLGGKAHFINCHGNSGDFRFYGEDAAGAFSDAMDSSKIPAGAISPGSVAAAECCYGAQLYNYLLLGRAKPICMDYLMQGAACFLGSSNVSYGPASSNGQADLICQLFLQKVLGGASSGRALLQARQDFILTQVMSTATNLKTIAQFLLLGDPSICPTKAEKTLADGAIAVPKAMPIPADEASERKSRRIALASQGESIASAATRPGRRLSTTSPAIDRFTEIARGQDMFNVEVFSVTGGAAFQAAKAAMDGDRKVVVATKETVHDAKDKFDRNFVTYRVLIGHIIDDGLFNVEECESR
ncbi:C25 family cysteine peptidase [Sinorhizobium meliloti]|uniref:C25 family cysteine peptidase n=1 Tax=Rhizobium meliloti TaxID=382 RepID=UPI0003F9A1FE|nr:C25 family cysteine peptidase [Sinorhizobium meliloti]UFX12253.1 C25 family cysteine peptidase [Sinorhizobium meliloti]